MNRPVLVPRSTLTEARLVRLFSYGVTVACTIGLLWTLGLSFVPWVGFAVGAVGYGIVSVYLLTRDEAENVIRYEAGQNRPHRFEVLPAEEEAER